VGILQKADAPCLQVGVDLGVVDHLAEQENAGPRVFFDCPESNLDGILHPIAKPEVPGEVYLQIPQVQMCRAEILLQLVLFLTLLLDGADQRAAVNNGDFELLHGPKGTPNFCTFAS